MSPAYHTSRRCAAAPRPPARRRPPAGAATGGCSQNGHLLSRGGGPNRWHSLVNCDRGDSTTSRFDSPGLAAAVAGHPSGRAPPTRVRCVSIFLDKNRRYINLSQTGSLQGRNGRRTSRSSRGCSARPAAAPAAPRPCALRTPAAARSIIRGTLLRRRGYQHRRQSLADGDCFTRCPNARRNSKSTGRRTRLPSQTGDG
jgi:hypothetical protein